MDKKPIAIVLGGTNPHIALLQNLKNRGYYTVLIDYYENPPAKNFADEHLIESTLDQEQVLEISKNLNADLIISACVDQANVTACYVAEKLGLSAPYSYETALKVTNKVLMKQEMVKARIPTSKFIFVDYNDEIRNPKLRFPLVVKPADSNGSNGVRKANNHKELLTYLDFALKISRNKKAIVEEFKEGIEVSIDCFIKNRTPYILLIRQKFNMEIELGAVMQSPGSFAPSKVSRVVSNKIQKYAEIITKSFGLDNTSLLIQALIKDDEVTIIEFAPRVGGGLSYRTIELITGFDIVDATINSYLGKETVINLINTYLFCSTNIVYAKPGFFDKITGYKKLKEDNIIENFYHYKTKGMEIGSDMSTRSRIGAFLVIANDKKELLRKMKIAVDQLEVHDLDGKNIMRNDIYDYWEMHL